MLNEEAETEKYREDSIHLSCKKEEYSIPYSCVHCCPEIAFRLWEHEEVHLFLEMDEDDAGYCDSSQDVSHIDSAVRLV